MALMLPPPPLNVLNVLIHEMEIQCLNRRRFGSRSKSWLLQKRLSLVVVFLLFPLFLPLTGIVISLCVSFPPFFFALFCLFVPPPPLHLPWSPLPFSASQQGQLARDGLYSRHLDPKSLGALGRPLPGKVGRGRKALLKSWWTSYVLTVKSRFWCHKKKKRD